MPRELKQKAKQAGRRGNNEGSIYQRKDGRWCAQVTIGYKNDGKIRKKYLYGRTRDEVARQVTKIVNDVYENGYATYSPNQNQQFRAVFDEWFNTFKAPNISSATEEKLRGFMKNHIFRAFGHMELEQITLMKLQRFFNHEAAKYSLQSIKHMKQLMNQFYNYAIKNKLVKENPISEIKVRDMARRDEQKERMALTAEQREKIFAALEQDSYITPILMTFAFTGLRPAELIALKWENIRFKDATISVKKAISREIEFDEEGNTISRHQVLSNTKTERSVRTFIMPAIVAESLQRWYFIQAANEQGLDISLTASEQFVFCTRTGTMRTYSSLRSMLKRFLKRIGLANEGISLYTFRHTFATMLLEARENPKIVANLMGHAKVLTTLAVYSHVISNDVYADTAKTLDSVYAKIANQ